MAFIRSRRMFWNPADPDVTVIEVYAGDPDDSSFIPNVDSRVVPPVATLPGTATEWNIDLEEGEYQLAVVAGDAAGNFSDPHQPDAWTRVPLDVTPPNALTGGGID